MTTLSRMRAASIHRATAYGMRVREWSREAERGDVPGWVLITIMTAGLVAALWLVAEPLLSGLFTDAVSGVSGP
ncbi:MAG TPA: hypothetical protein VK038_02575 [Ornithinicoccus sp.]|jgi:hypothetical protein|nr:hypothetical protein [Ornithinicoccus sp.]